VESRQSASLEPAPPDQEALFAAVAGSQAAMDDFASMIAGSLPVSEFFAPANVQRIMQTRSEGA
jgi:hypothetical protein